MRTRQLALLVVLWAWASACAPGAPAGLSDADRRAIKQAEDLWVKQTMAKDWTTAAQTYWTTDAVVLPPNGPAVSGQTGIANWLAAYPPFSDFTLEDVTVEGRGDLAYVYGRYSLMVTLPGASAATRDQGKHVTILKKQANGTWKASVGIFNSDLPAPAPAPAKK